MKDLDMFLRALSSKRYAPSKRGDSTSGGQQVTPTGDFVSCAPSALKRLVWWADRFEERLDRESIGDE